MNRSWSSRTQSIVDISWSSIAAGDHIKITLTDNGGNKVDLLLNVDSTAATALSGGAGADTVVDGDIHYADNGYTALNTVLGQAGHAGITVKLGYNGTTNAANKIFIQGTADDSAFHACCDRRRALFVERFQRLMHLTCQAQRMHKSQWLN